MPSHDSNTHTHTYISLVDGRACDSGRDREEARREGKESINLKIKLQVKLCAAVSKSPASASQRRRVDVYTRERISEYTHAHTRDRTQDAVVARADNKRSENGNRPWLTQSQPSQEES